jgi:hypothetical protein
MQKEGVVMCEVRTWGGRSWGAGLACEGGGWWCGVFITIGGVVAWALVAVGGVVQGTCSRRWGGEGRLLLLVGRWCRFLCLHWWVFIVVHGQCCWPFVGGDGGTHHHLMVMLVVGHYLFMGGHRLWMGGCCLWMGGCFCGWAVVVRLWVVVVGCSLLHSASCAGGWSFVVCLLLDRASVLLL